MRSAPHSLVLSAQSWDMFATLTYRDEPKNVETVIRHGREWLECVRVSCRLSETAFYWFLRPERGGVGGRLHLHVLLAVYHRNLHFFFPHPGRAPEAHAWWGKGMTKFRMVYGSEDPVTSYIVKVAHTWLADSYELEKTGSSAHGVPSPALLRRAGAQCCKEPSGQAKRAGQ